MASNIDDGDKTTYQLIDPSPHLSAQENLMLQKFIEEEINQQTVISKNKAMNFDIIYDIVIQKSAANFKYRIEKISSTISSIIDFFLKKFNQKSVIEDSEIHKLKNKKGVDSKNEIIKTQQCNNTWLQREKDEILLNQALHLSIEHRDGQIEFVKCLNETLAKSYEEEKSKLLTLLITEDIDFDVLANQLNKIWSGEDVVSHKGRTMNDRSALILAIIEIFEHDYQIINAKYVRNHISTVRKHCLAIDSKVTYQSTYHEKDRSSTFNVDSINDYLVNIKIRGDGNCLWSSVSHSLIGDYSLMKSLRLLTAASLMHFSKEFSEILKRQTSKFNYNHALTFEQLIKDSVSLQSWGDEFHIMALSLALKRPIYSYGSLNNIPESAILSYEQFREIYEVEHIPNHFKYIGDAADANKEPILLYYDGNSHYSAVLKRSHCVKPLVPFIQIIDALFRPQDIEISKQDKANDDDSSIEIDLEDEVEREDYYSSVQDDVEQNEIAKLNCILMEKKQISPTVRNVFRKCKENAGQPND